MVNTDDLKSISDDDLLRLLAAQIAEVEAGAQAGRARECAQGARVTETALVYG